jgi:hypothetical protein
MPATTTRSKTSNSTATHEVPLNDSTPTPFKLLHKDVLLNDAPRGSQVSSAKLCDVAQLSSGKRYSRWSERGVFHYQLFLEDPRFQATETLSGTDWSKRFGDEIENIRIRSRLRSLEMTGIMAGIARFRDTFGAALADHLGLERDRPTALFDTGSCSVGIDQPHGLLGMDAWTYIDRHASGDFGELGHFDPRPLSEEEQFLVGILPTIERQNSAAILTGNGVVRSSFLLPSVWQDRYMKHHGFSKDDSTKPPGAALLLTVLQGGVGRTLLKIQASGDEK